MTLPLDRHGHSGIANPDGLIAMRYMRQQQLLVACGPAKDKRQYVFSMRANISLAWVAESDVPCCLALVGGCCGQKKPGIIIYASEADIRQWTRGGGR